MKTIDQLIDNKIIQNIAIWIFVFIISSVSIQSDNIFLTALATVVFLCFPVYINNLLILPFFFKNKAFLGFLLFIFNIIFWSLIAVFVLSNYFNSFDWRKLLNMTGLMCLILISSSAIKIARDSFTRRQQEKEAELKLLKAQLNPHFLFNTLNNLYGLAVMKSDKLPNLMLTLSDLLRYSLYDTKEKVVLLKKEINYLENYICLEKIRLEDKVDVEFTIDGNVDNKRIAPMLLIVFVENAFKHLQKGKQGKSFVKIHLHILDYSIHFICVNSVGLDYNPKQNMEQGNSGIGLENVNKRLVLIYPNQHKLKRNINKNKFMIDLKLFFE